MLAARGSQGLEAVMTSDGAPDAEAFRVSVEPGRRPTLRPGAIVRMDNLRAHKAAGLREAMEQAGTQVLDLPPSSPALSPIEPCWSQRNTAWRTAKPRTREALDHASAQALATITVWEAHSWFHPCGYALQRFKNRSRILTPRADAADSSPPAAFERREGRRLGGLRGG
jgi:transposase